MSESEKYYSLIKNWHAKASEEDYFSKFMFEYLAFIAFLRTQWKDENEIRTMKGGGGKVTDRDFIQAAKQDSQFIEFWHDLTLRSTKDKVLVKTLGLLVTFLKKEPLRSDERWWNFVGFDVNRKPPTRSRSGILNGVGDYENLVEFWCSVRNNLFHGDKNPSLKRDQELVRFAFLTLNYFVQYILLEPREMRRVYPAVWEDFWHRFKSGKAEINSRIDGHGWTANIYECTFLDDHMYPILLLDKQLTQIDIISILNNELAMSGDTAIIDQIWLKIKSAAGAKKKELKEHFGHTVAVINKTFGLNLSIK